LVPAGEIDNREPAHAEYRSVFDHDTMIVWPPVDDGLTHAINQIGGARNRLLISPYKSCYATHLSK
jgi:hypothetical protein